jgi:hypothetical protein
MLKIRFHFDGKCRIHPRYNPKEHGSPTDSGCPGCESLRVIYLYTGIAERKALTGDGIVTSYKPWTQPEPEQTPQSAGDHEPEVEQGSGTAGADDTLHDRVAEDA